MPKKITTDEFIAKAISVHGNVYLYVDSVYVNSSTLVNIICTKHGNITVHPQSFLKGSGCKLCGQELAKNKNTSNTNSFIKKAKTKFKYDYSRTVYINSSSKVEIVCQTHGAFFQRPADHLVGHGCPECSYVARTATKIANGTILDPSLKDDFAAYTCDVWKHTRTSYRKFKDRIKNSSIDRSYNWHLDHVYSIYEGFQNSIPAKMIGHFSNLQMISREENITKNTQSWKTKEQLLEDYSMGTI